MPISIMAVLIISISMVSGQVSHSPLQRDNHLSGSKQLKEFYHLAARANVSFEFPEGFKEIKAPNNEYFSFDYGIELPGKDFEIWFQVKPQKENRASYEKNKDNNTDLLENPDSLYASAGAATAAQLAGDDKDCLVRYIPHDYLSRYNADAGKSFLLNLVDNPETKHYKYALLFTLQKFHTGTIMAVCFTNEKGPEFFNNINKARNVLKFKP